MGDKFRTMLNLEIIKSDPQNNLLYIKGSIPEEKFNYLSKRICKKCEKKNYTRKV